MHTHTMWVNILLQIVLISIFIFKIRILYKMFHDYSTNAITMFKPLVIIFFFDKVYCTALQ